MIYFIQQGGEDGPIKIGVAKNPARRLDELQAANPNELNLLGVFPGGLDEERALHRKFAVGRIRGEWFEADTDGLRDLIQRSALSGTEEFARLYFKIMDQEGENSESRFQAAA